MLSNLYLLMSALSMSTSSISTEQIYLLMLVSVSVHLLILVSVHLSEYYIYQYCIWVKHRQCDHLGTITRASSCSCPFLLPLQSGHCAHPVIARISLGTNSPPMLHLIYNPICRSRLKNMANPKVIIGNRIGFLVDPNS